MPGLQLLAVSDKVVYYAVLVAVACVAVGYVVVAFVAERKGRT
jgi:hypothetical protein